MTDRSTARLADSPLADDGLRPALGPLWAAGRRRRQRRRAGAAAALVVVAGLVAGGIAFAGPDGGQQVDVVGTSTSTSVAVPAPTGPQEPDGDPPPAEPDGSGPQVRASASGERELGGRALLTPGADFSIAYTGAAGWQRNEAAAWQRWDGSRWTTTHQVLSSEAGPQVVVGAELLPDVALPVTGSSTYLTPSVGSGWYRVCVDLRTVGDRSARPCTQVVVPAGVAAPSAPGGEAPGDEPPQEESIRPGPRLDVEVREAVRYEGRPAVRSSDPFTMVIGGIETWQRVAAARWQAWRAGGWTTTAWVVAPEDGEPTVVSGDEEPERSVVRPRYEVPYVVPADQPPGWYRLCVRVIDPQGPDGGESLEVERCVQLVVPVP